MISLDNKYLGNMFSKCMLKPLDHYSRLGWSEVERFSSDGDGSSFPHQRWGFWALVSAKPKDLEEPV